MKKYSKPYIVFFCLLLVTVQARAQEITGDTIYVDAKAEIAIRFPAVITDFYTIPVDAPYNIKPLDNGFTVIAKKKNTSPAPLFVTESKRTHRFFIVYKKNIDYTNLGETNYDYSTVKKLKERVKQLEIREEKYNEAIQEADNYFKADDLVQAKAFYTQALGLLNKPWPNEQIARINKLLKKKKPKKY